MLDDIHDFLVTHPAEVLVIVNQDYVTPKDFVAASTRPASPTTRSSRPRGADWPTLRELIERDRRLARAGREPGGRGALVSARLRAADPGDAVHVRARRRAHGPRDAGRELPPNRGPAGAPLFLVNHWINTDPVPRPSNAAIVNAYEALLRRARACERIRERRVNLLAVDFYRRGDVFAVVDALNADRRPAGSAG